MARDEPTWVEVRYIDPEDGRQYTAHRTQWTGGTGRVVAKDVKSLRAEGMRKMSIHIGSMTYSPRRFQQIFAEHLARHPEQA